MWDSRLCTGLPCSSPEFTPQIIARSFLLGSSVTPHSQCCRRTGIGRIEGMRSSTKHQYPPYMSRGRCGLFPQGPSIPSQSPGQSFVEPCVAFTRGKARHIDQSSGYQNPLPRVNTWGLQEALFVTWESCLWALVPWPRSLTADSPEGTRCLLKISSSFRSLVEHTFFSSSLTFQIRSFWAWI